ncbi:MAG: cytochrome c [Pyrinomonadaceae bacterium]
MLRKKIAFLIFIAVVAAAFACSRANAPRFVIADSKTYEASLFRQNCTICHGPEAEGKTLSDGKVIPNLREGEFKYKTDEDIYRHIAEGGNGMIAFKYQLTPREINMLVGFVQNDLRRK